MSIVEIGRRLWNRDFKFTKQVESLPESRSYRQFPNMYIELNWYQARVLAKFLKGDYISKEDMNLILELSSNINFELKRWINVSTKSSS